MNFSIEFFDVFSAFQPTVRMVSQKLSWPEWQNQFLVQCYFSANEFKMEFLNFSNGSNISEDFETEALKFVEEDVGPGDDSTTVSKMHDKNKFCPLCHHKYESEADFVSHSASHYARSGSTSSSTNTNSYPNSPNYSPNSLDTGYYQIATLDSHNR